MSKYKKGQASKEQLIAAKSSIDQKRTAAEKDLSKFKSELEFKQKVLADMKKEGSKQSQRANKLQAEISKTKSNYEKMQQGTNQMAKASSTVHL